MERLISTEAGVNTELALETSARSSGSVRRRLVCIPIRQ